MKMSEKLVKRVTSFAETYKDLSKITSDVKEDIEEMKELVKEGAESQITNFSTKSSVVARKFSKILEDINPKVEDASVAVDDLSTQVTEDEKSDESLKSFSRKVRIIKKVFSDLEQKFKDATEAAKEALSTKIEPTSKKESVVSAPMPGTDPDADPTKTNAKVSPNPPAEGSTVSDPSYTNVAESVNFSRVELYKFNLGNGLTAFVEFAEQVNDVKDLVDEVTEVSEEVPVEQKELTPVSEELPKDPNDEMIEDSVDKLVADMIVAGKEAVKSGDKDTMKNISTAVEELEEKAPGRGEEVVTAIENFAKEFNMKKNFSETVAKTPVCPKCGKEPCECTPEFTEQQQALIDKAMKAFTTKDKTAIEEVAKEAKELESAEPGQGEKVISFIETKAKNFAKLPPSPAGVDVTETGTEVHETCPECGKDPCECESEAKDKLVEAGIKAFANMDKDAMNKVAEEASKLKGGEEVVDTIENFAALYKLGFGKISKNFGNENFGVIGAVKELIGFAADKIISGEKFDVADISTKAEDLENKLPGAGEVVVSTIENFNSIAKAVQKKMTPETEEDVVNNFSELLEAFVADIPVADKTFAHKIKKACFEALEACDEKDVKKIKEFCNSVSKAFANVEFANEKLKNFCNSINAFCGKFAAFDKVEDTVPAEIAEKDAQLNSVLDTIEEKSAQLPATAQTFAKQMCAFCKSVKCDSEDKLGKKLDAIESIKQSFSDAGVNFDDESNVTKEPKDKSATETTQTNEPPKEEVASEVTEQSEVVVEPKAKTDGNDKFLNEPGTEDYDPTGENAPVEEEPVSAEPPADSTVIIPSHFSKGAESYDNTIDHLVDLNA